MGVISKSLKTNFKQIYVQVESRFRSLEIQLISEQPAQRVKAKGAALMLFVCVSFGIPNGDACGILPCLLRAVASFCVVAVALLLGSSHGRPASCRCYFCITLHFFSCENTTFYFQGCARYFFAAGLCSDCPIESRRQSCVCNFIIK